jgi:hypothetical protein
MDPICCATYPPSATDPFRPRIVEHRTRKQEKDIVVHLNTLDTETGVEMRLGFGETMDKRVVQEAIAPVALASAVATDPDIPPESRGDQDVANHLAVFPGMIGSHSTGRIRANQFEIVVESTANPVAVNHGAFSTGLDVIAARSVVDVAEAQPEHRPRTLRFVGGNIELVFGLAATTMEYLAVFHS